jgi:hypothetical protein
MPAVVEGRDDEAAWCLIVGVESLAAERCAIVPFTKFSPWARAQHIILVPPLLPFDGRALARPFRMHA